MSNFVYVIVSNDKEQNLFGVYGTVEVAESWVVALNKNAPGLWRVDCKPVAMEKYEV